MREKLVIIMAAIVTGCSYPDRAVPFLDIGTKGRTGIELVASVPLMSVGDTARLRIVYLVSDGTRIEADPSRAEWSMSGQGSFRIDGGGYMTALGEGMVRVDALLDGFRSSVSIEIRDTRGLVISEVFYDAVGADDGTEFVEIRNRSPVQRSLSGLYLTDGTAGRAFFFPEGASLDPGERAVVAQSGGIFAGLFGAEPDWSGMAFVLNNNGETITLCSSSGAVIDRVYIGGGCKELPAGPEWGSLSLPAASAGQSVHRLDGPDGDTAADWAAGPPTPGL